MTNPTKEEKPMTDLQAEIVMLSRSLQDTDFESELSRVKFIADGVTALQGELAELKNKLIEKWITEKFCPYLWKKVHEENADLQDQLTQCQQERDEARASCAAYRQFIEDYFLRFGALDYREKAKELLATDCGKAMLEEVERLRAALQRIHSDENCWPSTVAERALGLKSKPSCSNCGYWIKRKCHNTPDLEVTEPTYSCISHIPGEVK